MRAIILESIHRQMKKDKKIYFLTGDLGFHSVEEIEKDFPDRFINVGVAEQNMIGIASGLALNGKKVYVYSIIPFVTMRCFEQIRDDICYHNLNVTLLGAGAGLTYGILSSTHFALEDVAILRILPNMSIFSPADDSEAKAGMNFFASYHKPLYIRIGGRKELPFHNKPIHFHFGKGIKVSEGKDICIFSSGPIAKEVLTAVSLLRENADISATHINMHTLKPIDEKSILKEVEGKKMIVSVEEHFEVGGLGSILAEIISSRGLGIKVVRIGVRNEFIKDIGNQVYLRKQLGLDSASLYRRIVKHYKNNI